MDENFGTQSQVSEEQLQEITGGTPEDASTWRQNLTSIQRNILSRYSRGASANAELAVARDLNSTHTRLYYLPAKILSDGTTASRVGVLRPKTS